MQVTGRVHALKVPFQVPIGPGKKVDRFVYIYLIYGEKTWLVDSGVAGSERAIFGYVCTSGRRPGDIGQLFLTHSHPDHIGAALAVKKATGCAVAAHEAERNWIEDVDLQARERPVPGFHTLVGGPVTVDRILRGGETLSLEPGLTLDVIHTPGHSRGSLSFFLREEGALFSGDAVPVPGDLPIYDDVPSSLASLRSLMGIAGMNVLLASWDDPREGGRAHEAVEQGVRCLDRIHEATLASACDASSTDPLALCRQVFCQLGIPAAAVNPLTAKSIAAHLSVRERKDLFAANFCGKSDYRQSQQ